MPQVNVPDFVDSPLELLPIGRSKWGWVLGEMGQWKEKLWLECKIEKEKKRFGKH